MSRSPRPPYALAAALAAGVGLPAHAQHSDIDVAFQNQAIELEFGPEGQVFEGEFPTPPGDVFEPAQFTDDPGFVQEPGTDPFPVGSGLDYRVLQPLRFHNGAGFDAVPGGVGIQIEDTGGVVEVTAGTADPVTGPGVIGSAQGLHAHLDFTLTDDALGDTPPPGAYGLLMELLLVDGDFDPLTGVGRSDPFFLVFNFGLNEQAFEASVGDFAAAVPEPASLAWVGLGGLWVWTGRRRRPIRV